LGLCTYLAFGLYADFSDLSDAVHGFDWWVLLPVFCLSLLNYGLRWFRWHWYLRHVDLDVPMSLSVLVFASGLAMSVTPGKLGEVIKAGMLNSAQGIPLARSFPVVVTERLTDLLAVLILTGLGVLWLGLGLEVLLGGVALFAVLFMVLATGPGTRLTFRVAGAILRRHVDQEVAEEAGEIQSGLLRGRALAVGMMLGTAAWLAEAFGLYLVVNAFDAGETGVATAVFTYATGTLAGALSFLPGGLLVTEASMTGMLSPAVFGALPTEAMAIAATLIVRVATLWFAVAVGVLGLLCVQGRLSPDDRRKSKRFDR